MSKIRFPERYLVMDYELSRQAGKARAALTAEEKAFEQNSCPHLLTDGPNPHSRKVQPIGEFL